MAVKFSSKDISLDEFEKIDINLNFNEALKKLAEECCEDIKSNSRDKKWDDYAEGWTITEHEYGNEKTYTVHNGPDYRLTHLLEKGHLIVNKKGGVGYSAPKPHIKPAFEKVQKKLDEIVTKNTTIDIK